MLWWSRLGDALMVQARWCSWSRLGDAVMVQARWYSDGPYLVMLWCSRLGDAAMVQTRWCCAMDRSRWWSRHSAWLACQSSRIIKATASQMQLGCPGMLKWIIQLARTAGFPMVELDGNTTNYNYQSYKLPLPLQITITKPTNYGYNYKLPTHAL